MFQFYSWLLCAVILSSNIFAMYLVGPLPKEAPDIDEGSIYYDSEGYDEYGFDKYGWDRFGYDEYGFDEYGYDREGFDEWGFDEWGFDEHRFDRYGYNRSGYDQFGFDIYGYDREGFNEQGFDQDGYDYEGYDKEGRDPNGFDRWGFDVEGFDQDGYDYDGYDKEGRNRNGFDRWGFDVEGFDQDSYDYDGYDKEGLDRNGFDRWGFDRWGFDVEGFDQDGYDYDGYDKEGRDRNGHNRESLEQEGYNQEALTGSDGNEDPLPYDQKASGAKNHRLDRKFKQKHTKHFVSLCRAKKQAREVNTYRKLDRIAASLTKTQRKCNKQLFATPKTTQPKSLTADDGKAVFVGPSAQSPEIIDGKWAYNRVDKKDQHMPPRSKKKQVRQGRVYSSAQDITQRFCKNIFKNQAAAPLIDPANKSLQFDGCWSHVQTINSWW